VDEENRLDNPDEADEEEPVEKRPPSRLRHLLDAKQQADREAEAWGEIEDEQRPVPSHDRPRSPVGGPITPPQVGGPIKPPTVGGPIQPSPEEPKREEAPSQPPPTPPTSPPARPRPGVGPHPTDRPGDYIPPTPTTEEDTAPDIQAPPQAPQQPAPPGQRPPAWQQPPTRLERVRVDRDGMPLPARPSPPPQEPPARRAPSEDQGATVPGRSAYQDWPSPSAAETLPHPAVYPPPSPAQPVAPPVEIPRERAPEQARPRRRLSTVSCLARFATLGLMSLLIALFVGVGVVSVVYVDVVSIVPRDIGDLQARALQFETTRIRDSSGKVLYEINDPTGGRRDYVTLDQVSPYVIHATVATEEREFYTNPGFSPPAIARALYQNVSEGQVVSGASTITQQLTRALLLPPEERGEQSVRRKVREIFLAAELGRRFTKDEVLELYLNQIYYGNLAYGIEAASQTYFNKPASELTLAEASFLAGLPQAPALYDPVNNKPATLARQRDVLGLMLEAGCIQTTRTGQICVTREQIESSAPELAEIARREFKPPAFEVEYPHWVVYVQQLLEERFGAQALYTTGYDVYTTLDPDLQDLAQAQVEQNVGALADRNVTNGSVIVIDVHTGAILAMVGSRDFYDEDIDGQVNVALTLQQPGSSVKPFTYIAAFEKGWTPATVIWDVPIEYEIPGFGVYAPVNYDERFHGPVPARSALANSYNIPAVITLDYVGVPALLDVLNRVGITTLGDPSNPYNYGLSLTLGAGDVRLIEWTNAFATLARGGVYLPTYAIQRVEINGQVQEEYVVPEGRQVINPDFAYLISTILSDHAARAPAFGSDSILNAPFPAAAKTGTTTDYRDNWTMGYTTEVTIGVWVGNSDNTPMVNVSGVTGAGPIWRSIMEGAHGKYPAQEWPRPDTIFEQTVCADDGALPSEYCQTHSTTHTELFSAAAPPPAADEGLYRRLRIDRFTGLIANDFCPNYTDDRFLLALPDYSQLIDLPAFERAWLAETGEGQAWAATRSLDLADIGRPPEGECREDTPIPTIFIDSPLSNEEVQGEITIIGTVDAPNFSHYTVEFGLGPDPQGWGIIQGPTNQKVTHGPLARFDVTPFENMQVTIRVRVFDTQGHDADVRVTVNIANPTPEPEPTEKPEPTAKPEDTATPLPTDTAQPEPTRTPVPTLTPTPGE
jgi:penicillin-binding protein 1C